ncbi:T9SS type A sorting domain-containing protein [Chishuiella sp.]|uniref:T9SS type A sorting domain-containing protein n=1 Tax=Chishuiella sp. TaxID=1969467 RepID=UPI0028B0144D|nr:T9SS type A sorting domain-containing protein [Chishuiella sp.]
MKKKYPKSNIITDCNNSLSTNDINTNTLTIYPNPIKDYLEIKSLETIKAIEIISSSGERIFSKSNINNNHFKTNLSNLKAGVYILKIETGKKIEIKKVIKK